MPHRVQSQARGPGTSSPKQTVEVQGTGEDGVFSHGQLDELLSSARAGIETIYEAQRAALGI